MTKVHGFMRTSEDRGHPLDSRESNPKRTRRETSTERQLTYYEPQTRNIRNELDIHGVIDRRTALSVTKRFIA